VAKAKNLLAGEVEISNRYHFSNLGGLDISWKLLADDRLIQKGQLPRLQTPPGGYEAVVVPFDKPVLEPGVEYWLVFSFTLAQDTPWALAGHEIAWEQFKVPFDTPAVTSQPATGEPLHLDETESQIEVAGDNFRLLFNKKEAAIESIRFMGVELIQESPRLNFWRAPTENDLTEWGKKKPPSIGARLGWIN